MPRILSLGAGAFSLLVATAPLRAQESDEFQFGSSPNPVGSGARALGVGGAFIATADDATAASWNPGGLIALEKAEASMVLSYKRRSESFNGIGIVPGNEVQTYSYPGINYFSAALPFKVGQRFFVISINYQALIDFDMRVVRTIPSTNAALRDETTVNFLQRGALRAISPAFAFQVTPRLALGMTLNFSTSKLGMQNGWRQTSEIHKKTFLGANIIERTIKTDETFDFDGLGANIGMVWDVSPAWTIGAVIKTPVWGTLKRTVAELSSNSVPILNTPLSFDEPMRFPPSYGVGVAYRNSDELTISADVYRTLWNLFWHGKTVLGDDPKRHPINPISGARYRDADIPSTTQLRLGAEYLWILSRTVVPIRGGLFYDPEPGDGESTGFFGLALGTGVSVGPVIIDVAYQLRSSIGEQSRLVRKISQGGAVTSYTAGGDVWQHLLYASSIVHFN